MKVDKLEMCRTELKNLADDLRFNYTRWGEVELDVVNETTARLHLIRRTLNSIKLKGRK